MLEVLRNMDHADDFISVLNYLSKIIEHNITHQLLLDVGIFLRQITVTTMIYDQTSKYFWLLLQKLFKVRDMYCIHAHSKEIMEKDYHVTWVWLHVWHNYSNFHLALTSLQIQVGWSMFQTGFSGSWYSLREHIRQHSHSLIHQYI